MDESRKDAPEQKPASTSPAATSSTAKPAPTPAATRSAAAVPALRRRRIILSAIAAVVVVAAVVLAVVLSNRAPVEAITLEPVPGETVTLPVPTPAVAPIERPTDTALLAALPSTVLDWSVANQVATEELKAAGALEAHTLTYTNGTDDLVLVTAQFRTPEAAAAYVASLGLEGVPLRTEEVLVAGAPVGTMAAYGSETGERVVWTNGTTTFFVTAPVGAGTAFYDAFGM